MSFVILVSLSGPGVGITILTSVETGVVGSDVAAFYTMTSLTHSPVLELSELDAIGIADHVKRRTA